MAKRTGLGRGLGSLISGGVAAKKAPSKKAADSTKKSTKGSKAGGKKKKASPAKKPTSKKQAAPAKKLAPAKQAKKTVEPADPIEGTKPFPKHPRQDEAPRETAVGLLEIPINRIRPNPHQPRREFKEESLRELADSILAEGLLQPVVVRRKEDMFELIAGERRWRACQQLKLKVIPARVIDATETSSAVLSLIENLQREDLNPIEEAMGYASLLKDFDLTQEQVAERVGRSRAAVANALRLLQLSREIQGYLIKGHLSVGHAKVLLGVEDGENRLLLARQAIERGWSVRELERRVEAVRKPGDRSSKTRTVAPSEQAAIEDLQKQLSTAFSTRVTLKHTPKKGRIVIEYYGNDDLQRIMETMGLH
jgi:ParB family chromosome partitioning protein